MGLKWCRTTCSIATICRLRSIGACNSFPYFSARVLRARETGMLTVEINPESTAVTRRVDAALLIAATPVAVLYSDLSDERGGKDRP
jgi:hypothetical protein